VCVSQSVAVLLQASSSSWAPPKLRDHSLRNHPHPHTSGKGGLTGPETSCADGKDAKTCPAQPRELGLSTPPKPPVLPGSLLALGLFFLPVLPYPPKFPVRGPRGTPLLPFMAVFITISGVATFSLDPKCANCGRSAKLRPTCAVLLHMRKSCVLPQSHQQLCQAVPDGNKLFFM
jgi:hypothetical protein